MSDAAALPDRGAPSQSSPPPAPRPAPGAARLVVSNRPLLIGGAMAAMIMQVLDTTIANVALPHMQASLGATTDTITWVLTSYVLASAIALPATGWLVNRLGLRTVFVFSVAAFTFASVLCGLAQNMPQIVGFRVLQGLAGAFLAPLAQTVLLDASSEEERPRMMIIYSQGVLLGPIIGPVLGGYITENFSWHWVFLINLPVGIITGLVLFTMLPNLQGARQQFDFRGWALLGVAVAALQLMLDRGQGEDWFSSAEIVIYAVMALAAFWMAGVHLFMKKDSIFPRELFTDMNLVLCVFFTFIFGTVTMSVMALLPGLLQQIYGYPAIDAGWLLIPRGLGMLLSMTFIGSLIAKLDARLALAIGLGISGGSMWMMTGWTIDMPATDIFLAGLVQGVGFSFLFMPLNILAFATLPGHLRTHATSLLNLIRNIGQSIGLAVCTVLLSRNIQVNHAELGARITQYSFPVDVERLSSTGQISQGALSVVNGIVTKQAAMISYLNDFWFMAIICWAAIPLIVFTRKPKPAAAPPSGDIPH
ncbi:DHA2 family efflux MFS transporter permease subunit [Croceicoccus pelagius]|uniref:EmrB/QacA family drug resistance transporter n=1 Tax=Croceicoccus pelagius TaxID=1703341 RepID=A0A917DHM0_9SPHN|nr:DHA2 family efflux MFS transporter permease subunit [Croceicoccus pelagius]GGD36043.1 EmrB/QacA family drug resistance transporter [Croceicoccus pelagius]